MRFRLATVTLLAAVAAFFALQTLTSYAYSTFSRWSGSQALFYVNPQNQDLSEAAAEAAVLVGMNAWNTQGGANFSFLYGGRVNDSAVGYDARNVLIFRNAAGNSPGTIATTYSWTNNGRLVDADIVFFDASFTFVAGTGPCSNGIFVEDIAAHEFGHALGLNHSTDPAATMVSGYSYCSQDPRTLAPDDIAAIQSIYGASATTNTPPTVTISSPTPGLSLTFGSATTFAGAASDTQDGNLSSSISWASSLDGAIGTGVSFTRTLSTGVHLISASVTDSRGAVGSASVTVTVTPNVSTPLSPPGGANVALATAGAVASASSAYSTAFPASSVINGDRAGVNWGNGGGWHDATSGSFPDWVQVDFGAAYSISQVNVFSVQDTYWAPSTPTSTQTFSAYGVRSFDVQYWTGTTWATVPGASVTGNNLVWRTVTFTPVTTQKIRVVISGTVDGWSRLTEIEAYATDGAAPPPPPSGGANVALATAGAVASASSAYSTAFPASSVINGDRAGVNWGNGGGWHDATSGSFPDWVQVDFGAAYSISQVNVFSVQDTYWAPSTPTSTQTFSAYGVRSFDVQYWTGTTWATVPGASVTGNNLVWRTVTFTPVTTQKIRVVISGTVDGWSRLTEIEAYATDGAAPPPPPSGGANVALATAGAVASASSAYSTAFPASSVINGDRAGVNWGNGGGWHDATSGSFPDWVQVDFGAAYSISQVNVFSVQDTYWAPSTPTSTQTFSAYGVRSFDVQYWTGTTWATVPGASVTGNNLVWRTVTFTPVTTQKIRVVISGTVDGWSRLTEIEAFSTDSTGSSLPTYETYTIVRQYPHDSGAFTQGLELTDGTLYESTGLNGSSSLRQVDLATGTVLRKVEVPAQYFAEGMTLFQGKIFQLTWQSGIAFVYDPATFVSIGQFSYSGEGWGLTHDSQYFILSDGTNQIRFIDPATFQTVRTISVVDSQSAPVMRINELEYINGQIFANIWQTDTVIRIDPATGQIVGWIDLRGLLPAGTSADVLNGIAYDAASGHLLVTGKFWPTLFEITLRPAS